MAACWFRAAHKTDVFFQSLRIRVPYEAVREPSEACDSLMCTRMQAKLSDLSDGFVQ